MYVASCSTRSMESNGDRRLDEIERAALWLSFFAFAATVVGGGSRGLVRRISRRRTAVDIGPSPHPAAAGFDRA